MSRDRNNPPSEWIPGVVKLNDVTYVRPGATAEDVIVWHWCEPVGRWAGAMCAAHTLHSVDPLHLEPSLACERNTVPEGQQRCTWHGWIRAGKWSDA